MFSWTRRGPFQPAETHQPPQPAAPGPTSPSPLQPNTDATELHSTENSWALWYLSWLQPSNLLPWYRRKTFIKSYVSSLQIGSFDDNIPVYFKPGKFKFHHKPSIYVTKPQSTIWPFKKISHRVTFVMNDLQMITPISGRACLALHTNLLPRWWRKCPGLDWLSVSQGRIRSRTHRCHKQDQSRQWRFRSTSASALVTVEPEALTAARQCSPACPLWLQSSSLS